MNRPAPDRARSATHLAYGPSDQVSTKAGQVHLDFGCGCGWLLRWWPRGSETRLYGCDYTGRGRARCSTRRQERCGGGARLDMAGRTSSGRGVAPQRRALRRAPRSDPDHRAGRVDRRDRRRRGVRCHRRVILAAVLGLAIACMQWWAYFDVVALVSARRLAGWRTAGAQRARPRLLLLPALSDGRRHRPRRPRVEEDARPRRRPAEDRPAQPCWAESIYLLALGAFRYRHIHSVNLRRTVVAALCFALIPLALEIPATASVGRVRPARGDDRVRHALLRPNRWTSGTLASAPRRRRP